MEKKNIPQVTVSSLTPGSCLANLFTHLFIQSNHSLSRPNSYTLQRIERDRGYNGAVKTSQVWTTLKQLVVPLTVTGPKWYP